MCAILLVVKLPLKIGGWLHLLHCSSACLPIKSLRIVLARGSDKDFETIELQAIGGGLGVVLEGGVGTPEGPPVRIKQVCMLWQYLVKGIFDIFDTLQRLFAIWHSLCNEINYYIVYFGSENAVIFMSFLEFPLYIFILFIICDEVIIGGSADKDGRLKVCASIFHL